MSGFEPAAEELPTARNVIGQRRPVMAVLSHAAIALKTGWEIMQGSFSLPWVKALLLLPWWHFPCSQRSPKC